MHRRALTLLVAFVCLASAFSVAQQFTGRVTDPSGAVVPKAQIIVHNEQTNVDIKSVTNETGNFTVPYLKPGVYSVSASADGFKKAVRTGITLEVGQTSTVNFALAIGAKSDTVTVQAEVAQLDFAKADRGEVVENTRVTELPLNGRDPQMLSILNASSRWTGSPQWQRPFDNTQQALSINGAPAGNNELMLDGMTNETARGNSQVAYVPPVDVVQEFKIVTNPYDAEHGRAAGGVVDMTLKSGTNKVHGNLYEYARRNWLDANSYRNNYVNAKSGDHKLDQWGLELDGPVYLPKVYDGRNKSFFVVQYENWDEKVPDALIASVPDPSWLTGDFSNLVRWNAKLNQYTPITIYDPLTLHSVNGKLVRDPFPNNKIPASRLDPTALKVLSYYPAPNLTPVPGTNPFANNYWTPNPTTDIYRNVVGKWDQNLSDQDRWFLRYGYWERLETRSTNGMPGFAGEGALPQGNRSHTFATDWVHTFNPNLQFDFRATTIVHMDWTADGPSGFNLADLGWPDSMISQLGPGTDHFPQFTFGGVTGGTQSSFATLGNWGPKYYVGNSLAMMPSLTWIKSKHNIHIGTDLRLLQMANNPNGSGPRSLSTNTSWTQADYQKGDPDSGNSIASFLLGTLNGGSTYYTAASYYSQHYFAPFIQDDWKVTPRLTLNLGLRWDFNGPQYERQDRVDYIFDTTAVNPVDALVNHSSLPGGEQLMGGITFLGVDGKPRSLYPMVKTNIQPRFGFAYGLNDKTVLRGGFGEMFMNPNVGGLQVGFSASTPYTGSLDGGKTPLMNLSNPFPTMVQPTGSSLGLLTSLAQGVSFINPQYKTPSYWSYSLGVQRELTSHDTVDISYVGSRTYNRDTSEDINRVSRAYYEQCNVEMGGDIRKCTDNGNVPNPFYHVPGFEGTTYYTAPTINGGNLTRSFPEFGGVTEYQLNGGQTWYNSLQVTGTHKMAKSLTLHGTWSWSKNMYSGGWADQVYGIPARGIDGDDRTHRVTLSGIYMLPVGHGHMLLPNINRIVDGVIGGWQLGGLFIFETGKPWGVPSGLEYVKNAHVDPVTSSGFIRGVAPCVALTDKYTGALTLTDAAVAYGCTEPDFIQRPSYAAVQNVEYTGIRLPSYYQFDANLTKNFRLTEAAKLLFRVEAFNVLNHPLWQLGYNGTATDANFGTIQKGVQAQSNLPRQVQLAIKVVW